MSKEQSLSNYLKKCADPAYSSKVIGGGIIFKKAQAKESWKKRTYYVKDDQKLLYFFYGGKAKPPLGMLDVTSTLLAVGPADDIKKSGAVKTEAVAITISLASESADNNNKHFVFETASEAKKFALMLSYVCKNSNVLVRCCLDDVVLIGIMMHWCCCNADDMVHVILTGDERVSCCSPGVRTDDGLARPGGGLWR